MQFLIVTVGILGIGAIAFLGGDLLKKMNILKGKSALKVELQNGTGQVLIEDNYAGPTPYESKDIIPGQRKITVKKDDREYSKSFNLLSNNRRNTYMVVLNRDLGTSDYFSAGQNLWFEKESSDGNIRVISEPQKAKVFIDNTQIGETPFTSNKLTKGEYDLSIEAAGYETQKLRINIEDDVTSNIEVKLFPKPIPDQIKLFEGDKKLYDLSMADQNITLKPEEWVKAVVYWNNTRTFEYELKETPKDYFFDYFLDYEGNFYNFEGKLIKYEDISKDDEIEKIGYLGNGVGLSEKAKNVYLLLGTSASNKIAIIKETGTGWLRVRSQPSASGEEIAKVNVGEKYTILEEQTSWLKIKVSDKVGWISKAYATIQE